MAYKTTWTENELAVELTDERTGETVNVYLAYDEDDQDDPLTYSFTPYPDSSVGDSFDIRGLKAYAKLLLTYPGRDAVVRGGLPDNFRNRVLRLALNTGELDKYYAMGDRQ